VLLQLFAYLNREQIKVDFVLDGTSAFPLGSDIRFILEDNFRFQQALSSLLTFSLISMHERGAVIIANRLLQFVIQEHLNENMRANMVSSVLCLARRAFPDPADPSNHAQCRKHYSQAVACLEYAPLALFNTDL